MQGVGLRDGADEARGFEVWRGSGLGVRVSGWEFHFRSAPNLKDEGLKVILKTKRKTRKRKKKQETGGAQRNSWKSLWVRVMSGSEGSAALSSENEETS